MSNSRSSDASSGLDQKKKKISLKRHVVYIPYNGMQKLQVYNIH